MRCSLLIFRSTILNSITTVLTRFLAARISDRLLFGRALKGMLEKPAHHKPTNKKDSLGPKEPSVIPNQSGFRIKIRQIICSVTQPTYPYANPCALTLSCLSGVAISGRYELLNNT